MAFFTYFMAKETGDAAENTMQTFQNIPNIIAGGAEGVWEQFKDLIGVGGESSAPSASVEMTDAIADQIREGMDTMYLGEGQDPIVGNIVEQANGLFMIEGGDNHGRYVEKVCSADGGLDTWQWCADMGENGPDDPIADFLRNN